MRSADKTMVTVVARVLGILTTITVPRARLEQVPMRQSKRALYSQELPQSDEVGPGDSARDDGPADPAVPGNSQAICLTPMSFGIQ